MSPVSTVGLTISGNTPRANCLDNVRYRCGENVTSFHLFAKSRGAERCFPGRQSCVHLQLQPSLGLLGRYGRHGLPQLGRKSAFLPTKARQAHRLPCRVACRWRVAFGPEVRDGERSGGDGEEGRSCPGGQANLGKMSRPVLCRYSERSQTPALTHHRCLFRGAR